MFEAMRLIGKHYDPALGYMIPEVHERYFNVYRGELFVSSTGCSVKNVRYFKEITTD